MGQWWETLSFQNDNEKQRGNWFLILKAYFYTTTTTTTGNIKFSHFVNAGIPHLHKYALIATNNHKHKNIW